MSKPNYSPKEGQRPHGFYTYAYLRSQSSETAEAGTPYYIGKGKGRRAWRVHRTKQGDWRPPANEFVLILKANLNEQDAFQHEKYMIALFGLKSEGGILINSDLGGLGSAGRKLDAEHIEAIKSANRNRVRSPEERARLSVSLQGHVVSEETRRKIGQANRGRVMPRAAVESRAAALRGIKRSPEFCANLSAKLKGRKITSEHTAKRVVTMQHNAANRNGINPAIWRQAPQVRRSEVPDYLRNGWTISEIETWLLTGQPRIHPLLQRSAERMQIPLDFWQSLKQRDRSIISRRWRRGLRGNALLNGYT